VSGLGKWTGPVGSGPFRFGGSVARGWRIVRRVVRPGRKVDVGPPGEPEETGLILTREPGQPWTLEDTGGNRSATGPPEGQ